MTGQSWSLMKISRLAYMFEQLQVDMLDKSADLTYNNMIKVHNKAAELQNKHGQREGFYG